MPIAAADNALHPVRSARHYSGLELASFQVTADFAKGVPAGKNLASRVNPVAQGVWELKLARPITDLAKGKRTVAVMDKQGNISRIERTFSAIASRP